MPENEYLIVNKTEVTAENTEDLSKTYSKNAFIFIIIFSIAIGIIGIVFIILNSLFYSIFFILIAVLYPFLFLYMQSKNTKKLNKFAVERKTVNIQYFNNDHLLIKSIGINTESTLTIEYDKIFKIKSSNDNVFIFVSPRQAFVVGNNGYEIGNRQELINLLKAKLPSKKVKGI
jgi:hypothetical protein